MRDKNLIKKSLYFHLRQWLIDGGFVINIEKETLVQQSSTVYKAVHDNWVFEDLVKYPVNIYGTSISYNRNFLQGIVTFEQPVSNTISADYTYIPVTLRERYPEAEEFQYIDLPLLVIGIGSSPMTSIRLGGDKRVIHDCQIDIFARNDDEKDELQNLIEDALKDNPNFEEIDLNQGFPLTETGEINPDYEKPIKKYLNVREIESMPILASKPTIKERYRVLITFKLYELRPREF